MIQHFCRESAQIAERDGRRKKEAFVVINEKLIKTKSANWGGLPSTKNLTKFSSIHFIVLNVCHYVYIHASRCQGTLTHYDSSMYSGTRISKKTKKDKAMEMMSKIRDRIGSLDVPNCRVMHNIDDGIPQQ